MLSKRGLEKDVAHMQSRLELWGGHECTVHRAGDGYGDQTLRSGHDRRTDDIARFAALGLSRLRYPLLWERIAPEDPEARDWRSADVQMEQCQRSGLSVIAGLVHHGSGPKYATFETDQFADGLARHAAAVAERYPWIDAWTPVNEPNTTARFAGLYGHWYPHQRSEEAYWRLLLNEIEATQKAMKAVRKINAKAILVQTDDLGRVTAAQPELGDQAEYENVRRFMSWDLLAGRVTRDHPFFSRLARMGFERRLLALADDPCPADIIGINHYLTSDRFLDGRAELYPGMDASGNGRQRYVDVEAVRTMESPPGLTAAIDEAWARYATPIALTEIHNGCSREEQLRWLREAWQEAHAARDRGVDLRAVTVWSLLGAFDWNSLLTRQDGFYEPGAFDIRSSPPRLTALGRLVGDLARGRPVHPVADEPGWWRRNERFLGPFRQPLAKRRSASPPILIVGATGTLGAALARGCEARGLRHLVTTRSQFDLHDPNGMAEVLDAVRPWGVINAAGWVRVDEAERAPDACMAANARGAAALAQLCAEQSIKSVSFSSDLVFDGASRTPYTEDAPTAPLNAYGRSKQRAEEAILALRSNALIIRTAAFFSPHDRYNFAVAAHNALRRKAEFPVAEDCVISPTYVPDLVEQTLDIMIDDETGVWHLANEGAVSWAQFAEMVADALRLDKRSLRPRPATDLGYLARRPAYAALGASRGRLMPPLEDAIVRFARAVSA